MNYTSLNIRIQYDRHLSLLSTRFFSTRLLSTFLLLGLASTTSAATLNLECQTNGDQYKACVKYAQVWAQRTGNKVNVTADTSNSSSDSLERYRQQLETGNSTTDVFAIDVVWPSLLGEYLLDLTPYLKNSDKTPFFKNMLNNNARDGKLIALPWYSDAGLLYYRTDLLEKYGYKAPPVTWLELFEMANKIQTGERVANADFAGYLSHQNPNEGFTCIALEWISSYGGGNIVDYNGKVTVNNKSSQDALELFASQLKKVSPANSSNYTGADIRKIWQAGNGAFMRDWPISYTQTKAGRLANKFAVAVLPRGGVGGKHAATLGGWQLAANKNTKSPKEAADLIRFLTSSEIQKERIAEGALPTIKGLYQNKDVLKSAPYLADLFEAYNSTVNRPSAVTGKRYTDVSEAFRNGITDIIQGKIPVKEGLVKLEADLNKIKGAGW